VDNDDLRESSLRMGAFVTWYIGNLSIVDKYFGVGFMEMLKSAVDRLDNINPAYVVDVVFEKEIYTAQCRDWTYYRGDKLRSAY
jgi:hypothetical protein